MKVRVATRSSVACSQSDYDDDAAPGAKTTVVSVSYTFRSAVSHDSVDRSTHGGIINKYTNVTNWRTLLHRRRVGAQCSLTRWQHLK